MARRHPSLTTGSLSRAPIPDRKDSDASPTFVHPHPRHGGRRLQFARSTSANHPVYLHHKLYLVDHDDTPADHHHNGSPYDDNRSRTRGANVSPIAGSPARSGYAMSAGDREPDPRVLGPVRTRGRGMGDRDRLARVQLPARRGEPHWLLLDLPDGPATPQGVLRSGWLSRLVRRTLRRQGLGSGRSVALCVLGLLTLAALAREVL